VLGVLLYKIRIVPAQGEGLYISYSQQADHPERPIQVSQGAQESRKEDGSALDGVARGNARFQGAKQ
jgi:hypothetical protein